MNKKFYTIMKELTGADGSPGNSIQVSKIFKNFTKDFNLTFGVDLIGSSAVRLVGKKCPLNGGYKRRILVTAKQESIGCGELDTSIRGKYKAPGLNTKSGVLCFMLLIEDLLKTDFYDDIFFVLTSLDLEDGHGSFISAEKIKPTISININWIEVEKKSLLGKGPIILDRPIINSKLLELSKETLNKKRGCKARYVKKGQEYKSNTDTIVRCSGGIACFEICIPVFIEKENHIVSKSDIENTHKLLKDFILKINTIESFLPEV